MITVEITVWNDKKQNFENWDLDLRIARIHPDCGGVIIKIYAEPWDLRINVAFCEQSSKNKKIGKHTVLYSILADVQLFSTLFSQTLISP